MVEKMWKKLFKEFLPFQKNRIKKHKNIQKKLQKLPKKFEIFVFLCWVRLVSEFVSSAGNNSQKKKSKIYPKKVHVNSSHSGNTLKLV